MHTFFAVLSRVTILAPAQVGSWLVFACSFIFTRSRFTFVNIWKQSRTLISSDYYIARACKYITLSVLNWSILGAGFSRNAHRHYERCYIVLLGWQSAGNGLANYLKVNKRDSFLSFPFSFGHSHIRNLL